MGEIKKAWEIALEKAQNIKELPKDQIDKYNIEKCLMIGSNLAIRYLEQADPRQLEHELKKYFGKEKEVVKQAMAKKLIQAIETGNQKRLTAIKKALFLIFEEQTAFNETIEKIKDLFEQYDQINQKKKEELAIEGRKRLTALKISGEAIIEINPAAKDEWKQDLTFLKQLYEEKLNPLKLELEVQIREQKC
jgi:hypothetical protein